MKAFLLGMGIIVAGSFGGSAKANLVVDCAEGYTFVEGKGCVEDLVNKEDMAAEAAAKDSDPDLNGGADD